MYDGTATVHRWDQDQVPSFPSESHDAAEGRCGSLVGIPGDYACGRATARHQMPHSIDDPQTLAQPASEVPGEGARAMAVVPTGWITPSCEGGSAPPYRPVPARTIARMPFLIASGSAGQASITAARSGTFSAKNAKHSAKRFSSFPYCLCPSVFVESGARTFNPRVTGSSPVGGNTFRKLGYRVDSSRHYM